MPNSLTQRDRELLSHLEGQMQDKPYHNPHAPLPDFIPGCVVRVEHANGGWHYWGNAGTLEPGDLLYVRALGNNTVKYYAQSRNSLDSVPTRLVERIPNAVGLRVTLRKSVHEFAQASKKFSGEGTITALRHFGKEGDLTVRVTPDTGDGVDVPFNSLTLANPSATYQEVCDQLLCYETLEAKKAEAAEKEKISCQEARRRDIAKWAKQQNRGINQAKQSRFVRERLEKLGEVRPPAKWPFGRRHVLQPEPRNWGIAAFALAWLTDRMFPRYRVLARWYPAPYGGNCLSIYGDDIAQKFEKEIAEIRSYPQEDGPPKITVIHCSKRYQIGTSFLRPSHVCNPDQRVLQTTATASGSKIRVECGCAHCQEKGCPFRTALQRQSDPRPPIGSFRGARSSEFLRCADTTGCAKPILFCTRSLSFA